MLELRAEDDRIATWAWSRVEIVSAVERRVREEVISRAQRLEILGNLETLASSWDEVIEVSAVRSRAMTVLARQDLRAADSAQLGAALIVSEDEPRSLEFVCLDRRLAVAAEREGFRVLGADTTRSEPVPGLPR